jgi:hypothetical protein
MTFSAPCATQLASRLSRSISTSRADACSQGWGRFPRWRRQLVQASIPGRDTAKPGKLPPTSACAQRRAYRRLEAVYPLIDLFDHVKVIEDGHDTTSERR